MLKDTQNSLVNELTKKLCKARGELNLPTTFREFFSIKENNISNFLSLAHVEAKDYELDVLKQALARCLKEQEINVFLFLAGFEDTNFFYYLLTKELSCEDAVKLSNDLNLGKAICESEIEYVEDIVPFEPDTFDSFEDYNKKYGDINEEHKFYILDRTYRCDGYDHAISLSDEEAHKEALRRLEAVNIQIHGIDIICDYKNLISKECFDLVDRFTTLMSFKKQYFGSYDLIPNNQGEFELVPEEHFEEYFAEIDKIIEKENYLNNEKVKEVFKELNLN